MVGSQRSKWGRSPITCGQLRQNIGLHSHFYAVSNRFGREWESNTQSRRQMMINEEQLPNWPGKNSIS